MAREMPGPVILVIVKRGKQTAVDGWLDVTVDLSSLAGWNCSISRRAYEVACWVKIAIESE